MTTDRSDSAVSATNDDLNAIDAKLIELLQQRARLVSAMAAAEPSTNTNEGASGLLSAVRTPDSLRALQQHSAEAGPLDAKALHTIYREILSANAAVARPMTVACLGPEGTYSQAATIDQFGHSVRIVLLAGIGEIFRSVEAGQADFGVVPIENSTEGAVSVTHDLLMDTPLRVCGERHLRVQHQLLSQTMRLSDVKAVHAHPQSLAQCRHWLERNLPGVPRESESSNAAAAQRARDDGTIAAIAGASAAERYELNTLAAGIEDHAGNTTRFYVIGRESPPPSGHDATALLISAPHKPGGLRRMLQPLEEAGVSMTRIESRPGRAQMWEYVFFIDVTGHEADAVLGEAIDRLRDEAPLVRVLGSWPRAR